jgi:hypothetical protein
MKRLPYALVFLAVLLPFACHKADKADKTSDAKPPPPPPDAGPRVKSDKPRPPIDAAVAFRIETATFALG